MRFSEDGATWTPYEPWTPNRPFDLAPGGGFKTVYVQLTDGSATQTVSDMIYLHDADSPGPAVAPRAFIPIAVR
jgi:hypothetical protein